MVGKKSVHVSWEEEEMVAPALSGAEGAAVVSSDGEGVVESQLDASSALPAWQECPEASENADPVNGHSEALPQLEHEKKCGPVGPGHIAIPGQHIAAKKRGRPLGSKDRGPRKRRKKRRKSSMELLNECEAEFKAPQSHCDVERTGVADRHAVRRGVPERELPAALKMRENTELSLRRASLFSQISREHANGKRRGPAPI